MRDSLYASIYGNVSSVFFIINKQSMTIVTNYNYDVKSDIINTVKLTILVLSTFKML